MARARIDRGVLVGQLYSSDRTESKSAGDANLLLLRARPGRRQGFEVGIENQTDRAQTVLGVQYPHRFLDGYDVRFAIRLGEEGSGPFTRAVTIPPHGFAIAKISFITMCEDGRNPGRMVFTDRLQLRVRVGWFTRNEDVVLDFGDQSIGLLDNRQSCTPARWRAQRHAVIGGL